MLQINIDSKDEKPLMSRTELKGLVAFDGSTPSRAEVRKEIAKAMKTQEENVVVESLATYYGDSKADLLAYVYKNADDAKAITHKHITKRNAVETKEEEKKEAPAPAKEEAPAEKKEEAAEEKAEPAEKKEEKEEKAE